MGTIWIEENVCFSWAEACFFESGSIGPGGRPEYGGRKFFFEKYFCEGCFWVGFSIFIMINIFFINLRK